MHVNEMLPSERTLVSKYGVSRNVLREVLKSFSERGMIEVIPGKGARVVDNTQKKFIRDLETMLHNNKTTLKDIVEVRESLETQIFLKDMDTATDEDYGQLWMIFEKMEGARHNPEAYNQFDVEFHIQLAKTTKNSMYYFLISSIYGITNRQLFLITEYNPKSIDSAQIEHKGLIEAIKNHDAAEIRRIAHIHFTDILSISR